MRAKPSRVPLFALGLLAAVITALVYLPSLGNGFVDWDDHVYVYENSGLALEGAEFLWWAATSVVSSNWHPLTLLVYGAEYELWGLAPMGYHLVNVLLHSANTLLVYIAGLMIFRLAVKGPAQATDARVLAASFIAAVAFGIHPQHVESVAWVSELKDVLSGFFFLLSVIFYVRHAEKEGGRLLYWASFSFFALALLAKPMAITLPVVLLILDFFPLRRLNKLAGLRAMVSEKMPFFILIPVSAALTIWAQHGDAAMASIEASPLAERLDVAVRGLAFYLEKLVYPVDLAPFYVRPLAGEFYNQGFYIALAIVLVITVLSLFFWKRRALAAAWAWYLVTLLPVIGLVQVSDMAAADRYSYLPALGPVFFIAGLVGLVAGRAPWRLVMAGVFIVPLFVASAFLTVRQEAVWKDSVSLWTQEIRLFPTVQAYAKRARANEKDGMFREAAADYAVVADNTPHGEAKAGVLLRRAFALKAAGDRRAALADFSEVVRLSPAAVAAYLGRAELFLGSGEIAPALKDIDAALSLSPENPAALYYAGVAHERAGNADRGLEYLRRAAALGVKEAKDRLEGR